MLARSFWVTLVPGFENQPGLSPELGVATFPRRREAGRAPDAPAVLEVNLNAAVSSTIPKPLMGKPTLGRSALSRGFFPPLLAVVKCVNGHIHSEHNIMRPVDHRIYVRSHINAKYFAPLWSHEPELCVNEQIRRRCLVNGSNTLAHSLRDRRKQLGLTQLDAAELAGVSVRFVHDCETGKATVQLDRLQALASALGLTLTLTVRQPGQLRPEDPTP